MATPAIAPRSLAPRAAKQIGTGPYKSNLHPLTARVRGPDFSLRYSDERVFFLLGNQLLGLP